jgi:hypothetical protein
MLPNLFTPGARPVVTLSITRDGLAAFAILNATAGATRTAMREANDLVRAYRTRGLNQDIATEAVIFAALLLPRLQADLALDRACLCLSPCCWRPATLREWHVARGAARVQCPGCLQWFNLTMAAVTPGTLCPSVAGVQ